MSQSVLVVEEDRVLSGELSRALRREGYDVLVARDGLEALADLRRSRPDAVVTRLMLSGRSGFEVAAAAREAGLPVLGMTASFTGSRNREDALERVVAGGVSRVAFAELLVELDELLLLLRFEEAE